MDENKEIVINDISDAKRVSDSSIHIKELLNDKNYIVVLDTNILLKIYRASPDFAEYALSCLGEITDYVCLPYNVYWEYEKHRNSAYKKKMKSIDNSEENCNKVVSLIQSKMLVQCDELKKNGYPDIDKLIDSVLTNIEVIENKVGSYFEDHQNLDYLNKWDNDKVLDIVKLFEIMPEPSASLIYNICRKGEQRYKKLIPPGYKDNKKDGVFKYGDYISWVETYKYAQLNKKNVIFVTDDVKEDWWEKNEKGEILFRKELIKEFRRKTKNGVDEKDCQRIIPLISYDLYKAVAREYSIEAPDAITLILDRTDDLFVDEVQTRVFEEVLPIIAFSGTDYLDLDETNILSEGIDVWELEFAEFDEYVRMQAESGIAEYLFSYTFNVIGHSHDFLGVDEDTNEEILSPARTHHCSGSVEVRVTRELDTATDWDEDFEYSDINIEHVEMEEDYYEDDDSECDVYCSQCGKKIGYEWEVSNYDHDGNPLCEDCMITDENGFICPGCGRKCSEDMRAPSGTFCLECEEKFDA